MSASEHARRVAAVETYQTETDRRRKVSDRIEMATNRIGNAHKALMKHYEQIKISFMLPDLSENDPPLSVLACMEKYAPKTMRVSCVNSAPSGRANYLKLQYDLVVGLEKEHKAIIQKLNEISVRRDAVKEGEDFDKLEAEAEELVAMQIREGSKNLLAIVMYSDSETMDWLEEIAETLYSSVGTNMKDNSEFLQEFAKKNLPETDLITSISKKWTGLQAKKR